MPRLIALLVTILAGIAFARWLNRHNQGSSAAYRSDKTFRPKAARRSSDSTEATQTEDVFLMSRKEAQGLCDALTGAAIDADGIAWRCGRCQSMYNNDSFATLNSTCLQCGHGQFANVQFN
jgi:ribosomal protein S27AE